MTENKKYFGMTMMQVGILAGLGTGAILLLSLAGWLVLGNRTNSPFSKPPATETFTPQPTVTLILSPTLSPTEAHTPVPYESLIPSGWAQYRTALYEIWMLPGYKNAKADMLILGLGGNPVVDLSLIGPTSKKVPNKIYMTVSYEPMTADTFDAFINQKLNALGLPPSERTKVTINTVPAVRLVFSGRKGNNSDINELTYVILDGTTVWYVQYTAEIKDFYDKLSFFETSAKTFRVVK